MWPLLSTMVMFQLTNNQQPTTDIVEQGSNEVQIIETASEEELGDRLEELEMIETDQEVTFDELVVRLEETEEAQKEFPTASQDELQRRLESLGNI